MCFSSVRPSVRSPVFCPVLSCFVLCCPALSCLVLSCPVPSWRVLCCPVLSCPVLSCPPLKPDMTPNTPQIYKYIYIFTKYDPLWRRVVLSRFSDFHIFGCVWGGVRAVWGYLEVALALQRCIFTFPSFISKNGAENSRPHARNDFKHP